MTVTTRDTDSEAPDVPVGAGSRLPNALPKAIQPDLGPAVPVRANNVGPRPGAAAVRYDQFRTADPQAVRRFFGSVYNPGWRINGLAGRSAVSHRRCETELMTVDEVMIQGRVALEIPAGGVAVVIQPRAGSLNLPGGPAATVDFPVLVTQGMSSVLQLNNARFDVVTIAAEVLHKVAADWHAPVPQQAHFLNWRPRSRAAVRAWHRALDYVMLTLAAADTADQPLIVAGMAPLLASALLECYPSNVTEQDPAGEQALPETLKDAVAFIHRHANGDVSINEVAAAVHLTPRAVQYLFRRQLGTTPTEYMRRVRLNRAHQDLIGGAPRTTTVSEIAQRWGFAHTGRFAVLYRQTYGQSPHTTLRQMTSGS